MRTWEYRIRVHVPADRLFSLVLDFDRKHEWAGEILRSRQTASGEAGIGTTFDDTVKVMGRTLLVPHEVTVFSRNRRIGYRTTGGALFASTNYQFEPVGSSTDLKVRVEYRLPWYMRPIGPLVARKLEHQFESDFEALSHMACDPTGSDSKRR